MACKQLQFFFILFICFIGNQFPVCSSHIWIPVTGSFGTEMLFLNLFRKKNSILFSFAFAVNCNFTNENTHWRSNLFRVHSHECIVMYVTLKEFHTLYCALHCIPYDLSLAILCVHYSACIAVRALQCVHYSACIAVRALQCVHYSACIAVRALLCVHYSACITVRALQCVHCCACITVRALQCVHCCACIAVRALQCVHCCACITVRALQCVHCCACIAVRALLCVHYCASALLYKCFMIYLLYLWKNLYCPLIGRKMRQLLGIPQLFCNTMNENQ